ncbi:LOW QUALITY PROTEIN: Transposase [Phytophthora megakarya]|uniref:Transposase n=1 Tax=Phytophthora megakarya TaxID=4795 RepID=A0A225VIA1_9STRA|nr:LOW QUALITY PROTEIN: Transposase [Phytophthora megakarya]
MPSQPHPEKAAKRFEREQQMPALFEPIKKDDTGKKNNDVHYSTARRAVFTADQETKEHGDLRAANVKLTMEAMCKLEEYIEDDYRRTLADLRDLLLSDLGIFVGTSTIHRALQGMLYSVRRVRIDKATMNSTTNKTKCKTFVEELNKHINEGNMIVFQDEINFSLYLSRTTGWSRVGERAVVTLPPSQGKNLHVQGGVSSGTGIVLLQTHKGSVKEEENARFHADLFIAALRTNEFRELEPSQKVVIVTDNAPSHIGVETLVRHMLAEDGVMNLHRLEILQLGPYSPMLNPTEGCWNSLKARMKKSLADRKEEMMVRGAYDTYTEHRLATMKEAFEVSKGVITRRLVWKFECHCLRHCFAAERGEDMKLGA